ncbi:MAG: DUF1794 domain-containing protein [Calditrichaeota bacterium]|nr:MAG: DUF1794 domain-containing protein [Calditrichota bacterium]
MSEITEVNYGPLKKLIGVWKGSKGMDISPEPDGTEENPYYETITFYEAGDLTNAESQKLVMLRYHQVVTRKSDDTVFHDETGYWMWDEANDIVIHSLAIPRAVCVLAGGTATTSNGQTIFEVEANVGDLNWGILQSPFMEKNAKTTKFSHKISIANGKMSYSETTTLEIYGKVFEHTDANELTRQ